MLRKCIMRRFLIVLLSGCAMLSNAQERVAKARLAVVTARLAVAPRATSRKAEKTPPAVIWLSPWHSQVAPSSTPGNFTLMQKNKMFSPHLLIVPVGSSVSFPNADPFFHNVFSLFDGRRFDLGLYEAGSTRSVVFSREGVSYIFCNIHSEMSAVVISLATPLYGLADPQGAFHVKDVPDGDYDLHVWIEGQKQGALDQLTRRVHVAGEAVDLGEIRFDHPEEAQHLNKFGRSYEPDTHPIY
jgi:plastocyanin